MKKFLTLLIVFSGILYALAWSLDFFITRQFKQLTASPFENWNDIYESDIQADILIIGSSRAYVQFNPYILDSMLHVNSYNLGMDGRAIESQIIKYHTYRRKQQAKPKLILFEIYQGSLDVSNGYQRIQFVPYLTDFYLWKSIHQLEGFTWADAFLPCWRYGKYMKDIKELLKGTSFFMLPENKAYKGFCAYDKTWDGSMLAKIDTIIYSRNESAIKELDAFLKECKRDQIQVVFVMAPFYYGATQKIGDIKGMYQLFESITAPYDVGILDYTYDTLSYDTAYFYNASHLNRKGAELFTNKLARDLDSLGLMPDK